MSQSEALEIEEFNVDITDANAEYSVTLSKGTKWFTMQSRNAVDVRFAFTTGKVAGSVSPYQTLKSGAGWTGPEKLSLSGSRTIYFASGTASQVVEIVAAKDVRT